MDVGTLVETKQGERRLAVVQGTEGKKNLRLASATGHVQSVHPRQISFVIGTGYGVKDIEAFQAAVESLLDSDSVAIAWELLDGTGLVDPALFAELLFSEKTPEGCYAAYVLLSDDKIYFKQKGEHTFERRSAQQVADIQHQLAVTAQREQEKAAFEARVFATLRGEASLETGDRPRFEPLERYALYGDEANNRDQAIAILQLCQRPATVRAAFDLLLDLGVWQRHENLPLRRNQIVPQFSPALEALVQQRLSDPPSDTAIRRDLTHLHTYTIDDASTREIDDGLSVERLADGRDRLWIHIADPTRWLTPGDDLELEARRRGTTIYLPEQVIPMFPLELATGPMSLRQGEVSCALSFGVVVAEDGSISDTCVVASLIKVSYRLTYEDADEMLDLQIEPELLAVYAAAQRRLQWRTEQGAIAITLPEQQIKVIDGVPQMQVIEDTPSRQLVAEMMVLAGAVAADLAIANAIPVPYRHQVAPELPPADSLNSVPEGPARMFAIMRCMQRGEMSLNPAPHAGLGLPAYCQVTSPIRRYSDLMVHFQIKAWLAGEPLPFSSEDLQQTLLSLSNTTYEATQIERQTNRYWSLEYLRLQPARTWRSLVLGWLREHENLALVLIDDIALRIPVRFQRSISPGDWVNLEVTQVDPRGDAIAFHEPSLSN